MIHRFRFWLGAIVTMSSLLPMISPGTAQAASQGIGISPTSQEVKLNPGGTTSGTLVVINDGDSDITYKVYATDYQVHDENYHGDFTNEGKSPVLSAVSWFKLPSGALVVKSRQEQNLSYTITVPPGAAVGGHYAAVFIETIPPPPTPGSARINRIDRVGSLFYLAVGGGLHSGGMVLPLTVPLLQSQSPVIGSLSVKNTGNVHFQADVQAQLSDPFGKVGKPMAERGEVLPSTTRRFDISLPSSSPIGLYNVSVTVRYLDKSVTQSHWMLLMPRLTFIIVSTTLLAALIMGFWQVMRRTRRRHWA